MKRFLAAAFGVGLAAVAIPLIAQDNQANGQESLIERLGRAADLNAQEQSSGLLSFVEEQISTPDRQIRITGIDGVLSSNASIDQITVADTEGIYLIIENAEINWNQGALIFGNLQINSLTADAITYVRNPVATEDAPPPSPEATGFQVPELPVSVNLDELAVPSVIFGESVFGEEAEISVNGAIALDDGALDTNLDIERLDGAGGQLALAVEYANDTNVIDLDLTLTEPEDGIIANLLQLQDRPEVALSVTGEGALTALETELTLDVAGDRVLSGTGTVSDVAEGLSIDADVGGPIGQILPEVYRDFFGAETTLSADVLVRDSGGVVVPQFQLSGGQLSLSGNADTTQDGFLSRLAVDAQIAAQDGERVTLPVPGAQTSLDGATLSIDYGPEGGENWTATLQTTGLQTPQFSAQDLSLQANGVASNLEDPQARRVTFNADGGAEGLQAASEEVAQALGSDIGIGIAGMWEAGQPVQLAQLRIMGDAVALEVSGALDGTTFDGEIALDTDSIAPFSGLAGRELAGAADVSAQGTIGLADGSFDLALSGTASDLSLEDPALDPVLAGQVTLSGGVARDETGLSADNLVLENDQVRLAADGTYATGEADFTFDAALEDLALITDEASGRVTVTGTAQGSDGVIDLSANATIAQGTLQGRSLENAQISFEGTTRESQLSGTVAGSATLEGFPITLGADIETTAERIALDNLSFEAPGTTLSGALTRTSEGLLSGTLDLEAPDIETAASLALLDARGAVNADIALTTEGGTQTAQVGAAINDLDVEGTTIGSASADVRIDDLFGVPVVTGSVDGSAIAAGAVTVETFALTARANEQTTSFEGQAALENGTDISLGGSLAPVDDGFRVGLDTLALTQGDLAARLAQPTALTVAGESVAFDGLTLDVGSGQIAITGSAGSQLAIDVDISTLPLSIANSVVSDLGVAGTLNGTASITGAASDPEVAFDLQGSGLDAAAISEFGIAPFSFSVDGSYADMTVNLSAAEISGASGLNVSGRGTIPLEGAGLDLALDGSAPLTLAAQFFGDRGTQMTGNLVFNIDVTGSLDDPQIDGDLDVQEASVYDPQLDLGLDGITGTASLSNDQAVIRSLSASLTGGGNFNVSGVVPFEGNGLDVAVDGSLPLSLANRFVADRGARLSGTADVNAQVRGAITDPQISGSVSVAGGEFVDPSLNLRLVAINGSASLTGERAVIDTLSADLATGGSVSASGSVALDENFTSDLAIALNQATYADGDLFVATLNGNLALTGPLTAGGLLSGAITIEEAEVAVPETFGSNAALIDVAHRNPPAAVAATLARLRRDLNEDADTGGTSPLRLDVRIDAPNQIFVRGRGLDAELGGNLRVTGSLDNIIPVGGFELIRGRLEILGQRIDFESGTLTLAGDLDPFIDLVAVTEGEDITVFVNISGQVSSPEIAFGSQPMLPQDEVLARLLFDRSIDDLSPIQLAQLAAAAGQLVGGGGGPSFLDNIRAAAGLDDLDIVTDDSGDVAVQAGRYIEDNIYLSVQGGAGGGRVAVNLDVTDNLSARVETGTDGESSAGIFFEKDY